jgi:hypothetical protein
MGIHIPTLYIVSDQQVCLTPTPSSYLLRYLVTKNKQ